MTTTDRVGVPLVVNGEAVEVSDRHSSLLGALREELGLTSAKDGCAPSGQCGCCTVLIDGKARVSCQTPLEKVAGKEITTLEGFDDAERDRLASAFAAAGALQCGFCTPGILVRVKALLDQKGNDLTKDTTAGRLGAHLCRCTGYTKIFDAVDMLTHGQIPALEFPGGIGKSGAKYEATELALGDRGYIDDMDVPGMLHGALRLTDHARADIVASTPRLPRRSRASSTSSQAPTFPESSGSASSTPTGRSSSRREAAPPTTAMFSPSSLPKTSRLLEAAASS